MTNLSFSALHCVIKCPLHDDSELFLETRLDVWKFFFSEYMPCCSYCVSTLFDVPNSSGYELRFYQKVFMFQSFDITKMETEEDWRKNYAAGRYTPRTA